MNRKRVVILGATGSIGESALTVARDIPERMEIVGLAAKSNAQKLAAAANEVRPESVCLVDETQLDVLRKALDYEPRIFSGEAGLVVAGEIVMREARDKCVHVLPVDSEHNAIFQCLEGKQATDARRIILTASGGPFRETPRSDFDSITPEQALKHPTWNMGPKITIDSATLFNKGLEMIEAHWLFGVGMDRVEVVIHPQSIVHSMVEFTDGSTLAQLSYSNMCFTIQ